MIVADQGPCGGDACAAGPAPHAGGSTGKDAEIPGAEIPGAEIPGAEIPGAEISDTEISDTEIPDLRITVAGADPVRFSAVPAVRFRLEIRRTGGGPVRSVTLTTAVRIDAARRTYDPDTARAMSELFGEPERWATTMRPLAWTQLTTVVRPFRDTTIHDLVVPCAYDTELALAKYFHAVRDGDVPLDFLFSGTVFYEGRGGRLRTAQIPWTTTARHALPAAVWHGLLARYFEGSPWLRLSRDTYDELSAFRARHALGGWDQTVRALLRHAGPEAAPGPAPDAGHQPQSCSRPQPRTGPPQPGPQPGPRPEPQREPHPPRPTTTAGTPWTR